MVDNGYEREFRYVYGAVSPLEGEMDWMICPVMNTEQMGAFLAQISAAHPQDFIVMVVDGASSHVATAPTSNSADTVSGSAMSSARCCRHRALNCGCRPRKCWMQAFVSRNQAMPSR